MFDSHFHLTDPRLITNYTAPDAKVPNGVEIGADFESLPVVFAFAKNHPNLFCTAGVHPAYADTFSRNDFENFVVENLNNPQFVAIGECGLDYHRPDLPTREKQIEVFVTQIKIAHQYHKPLIIHSRDAWNDTLAVLVAHKEQLIDGVLIHCMSYSAENVMEITQKLPDVELYFAFGGQITYKNKTFLCDTLRAVPRDRILIETDAPYLAPVPYQGKINQPEYIQATAQKMAAILQMTAAEIEQLTTQNAMRFFKQKQHA